MSTDHNSQLDPAHASGGEGDRAGQEMDKAGQVESRGVDYIPPEERHGRPAELVAIWISANAFFGILVIGALPILFGLGWWASFWALTLGAFVGALFVAGMAVFAPRTGTTIAISSRAHFGIRGSVVAAALAVSVALFAYALAIWTGGQAILAGAAYLFGTPTNDTALAICMAPVAIGTIALAIWGHATIVKVAGWIGPLMFLLILGIVVVTLPEFDPGYAGGQYLLGDFTSTWLLAVATGASMPISYAVFVGDYSRYFPASVSPRRVMGANFLGLFVGVGVPLLVGAYAMTMFSNFTTPFVVGLSEVVPTWYVVPLLLLGLIGTLPQGTLALYSGGLGLQAAGWRQRRVPTTVLLAALGIATVFVGVFVFAAVASLNAFLLLILLCVSPFTAIMLVGYVQRHGRYSPADLQPLRDDRRSSVYWFTGGLNIRALVAFIPGVVAGFLFANTTVYVGPLVDVVGGINVSYAVAAAVSGVLYWALVRVTPEPASATGRGQGTPSIVDEGSTVDPVVEGSEHGG